MNILIFIFIMLSVVIVLIYVGYPGLLRSGVLGQRIPLTLLASEPRVSIIVPAHNEEAGIEAKILNLLALDYPKEKLEILVGSDGSTDKTEKIVLRYAPLGVKLLTSLQQRGKSFIQNSLVQEASGYILVFTDADCLVATDALKRMVARLANPRVGLVTGRPSYRNKSQNQISQNESIYLQYENWIRSEESARGLLCVGSGAFFGMRRPLWNPIDLHVGDDFVLPLHVVLSGFRNVLDETIEVNTTLSQTEIKSLFRMKMRIVSKDLSGLFANWAVLNPLRTGPVAIGLWLHKLLRWFVPYFLLGLFFDNLLLLDRTLFLLLFALQLTFYIIALTSWLIGGERASAPWSIPFSFCLVNSAAFVGILHFVAGKKIGQWKPVR